MTGNGETVDDAEVVVATRSHCGTERDHNEDACAAYVESSTCTLVVVADGVSGNEGGEIASQTAVDVTVRAFRESPSSWGPLKRLYRAAQQANIEIHDRALVVTELRRMSTTLTAVVVHEGTLYAAHAGDSRLYLVRDGTIVQKTKDHTVAAERIGPRRPKGHPDHSTITRSLGTELIAAIDRITFSLARGDVVLICTDGLYNVIGDEELRELVSGKSGDAACSALIQEANARGTPDNLTAAVIEVKAAAPAAPSGWRYVVERLLGR